MHFQKSKTTYILFKKELSHYFNSPIAYIFTGVFLLLSNWLFFSTFFLSGQVSMRAFFSLLPWIFLFLAPAITMRLWADEKKSGTIEILLTLPITNDQAVLAKFFGALGFLAFSLAGSLLLPITLSFLGDLDFGPVLGGYLGALLLASAYLALGLFISSLTNNQIIAFVLGILACFLFLIVGNDFFIASAPQFLAPTMHFMGLGSHFNNIAKGIIDSRDLIYYSSFSFFWLWLNVLKLEDKNN